MLRFHPLVIVSRDEVAEDAIALTFEIPAALRREFSFRAGQHVVLRCLIDGQEERRTYSIVNREGADALTIGIRVQEGGRVSGHLARVARPGTAVDVMTPNGSFHAQEAAGPRSYAAFAAGSGITPVLSIAASALARNPANRFQLWYGNTSGARTMFLDEVLALKDRYLARFSVAFVVSREPQDSALFNGRIDAAKLREFARHALALPAVDEFFICGPGTMAEDLQQALAGLGAKGRVHVEHFTPLAPAPATTPVTSMPQVQARPAAAAAGQAEITVVMDGRRRRFSMPLAGEVILDAAQTAGLDLPFSCRAGVCSTCRAKLVSGSAEMEHNVALEDWEVEAGYILCCQARPTSTALEISYDE
jgi:ring-1,2-phenylacetyl-CoA epoxidase subunit PaaE